MIPERLTPPDGALAERRKRLYPIWVDYCQNVSPQNMAMSLESCCYILWLAETLKPESAVDFGSGLTSYVLRSAVAQVCTVDDSQEWLDKTRFFLKRHRQPTTHMHLWDDYRKDNHQHDLVVYDFASGEIRNDGYTVAVGEISPNGVGIMDDMQHTRHFEVMQTAAEEHGRDWYVIRDWTLDGDSRYAAVVA